jgi:hypothetical protein
VTGRALAAVLALALLGCGGAKPPEKPAFDRSTPHWQDVFDRTPEILVIAHPSAIGRDKVYGPLLKVLSRMAAARAPAASGPRTIEVLETCDEVIYGLRHARGEEDAVVVLRGVRGDVDPTRLVDDRGRPMWHSVGAAGKAQELARDEAAAGPEGQTSLFVLPARTWVVALGDARERARAAFVNPFDRPPPARDDGALLVVRLDGPSLVEGVPRLHTRGAGLEPVGRRLEAVTLALRPGNEGLVATFQYSEEGAAAFAEMTLKDLATAIGRDGSDKIKWLGQTKVDRQASTVVARVALPPRLIADLPAVTGTELNF